jgi:myosin-crossreactive antigen
MEEQDKPTRGATSDEIALELMKFIASSTAYGKGMQQVGFAGKGTRTPEEQAESLLELFRKCRSVVHEESAEKQR